MESAQSDESNSTNTNEPTASTAMENSTVELQSSTSSMSSVTQFLIDLGHEEAIPVPVVFNLSGLQLDDNELELLKKGLKFVPTPKNVDNVELKADFRTLAYKFKWHFALSNSPKTTSDGSLLKL